MKNYPVKSLYQPDAIAAWTQDGVTYIATANEGDSMDYDGASEEDRGDALYDQMCPSVNQSLVDMLHEDDGDLRRMKITMSQGYNSADMCYDEVYGYGGRGFSIIRADTGAMVYDSGDLISKATAMYYPDYYAHSRSDDKGGEAESLALGKLGDTHLLILGMERSSFLAVFDISDPAAPIFHSMTTMVLCDGTTQAFSDPEAIKFVAAADNPTGKNIMVQSAANGIGSITVYEVGPVSEPFHQLSIPGCYKDCLSDADCEDFSDVEDDEGDVIGRVAQKCTLASKRKRSRNLLFASTPDDAPKHICM